MNGRFARKNVLVDALKQQKIVSGNKDLAERIASIGELIEVPEGTAIIRQGDDDTDVYLIVSGSFHIAINGKTIARRIPSDHVGEMAAILPVQRRAASVVAHEPSAAVKLSNSQMAELGAQFPEIWRCFARELAHRVEQRNILATAVNEKVRIFIMAPAAADQIAHAVHNAFKGERFQVVIWTDEAFQNYDIDSLEEMVDQSDVAITIVEPAGKESSRDEIIFELGFLMGRLGRHRTFLIEPQTEKIKLSEIAGINTITYRFAGYQDLSTALEPACEKLRNAIRDLGPNR
jgi:CRP/FNR family cyclic AMP-dependent transcriptional regulator